MGGKITTKTPISCQRCGDEVPTFSVMRKWCVDCRRVVSLEQAKERKKRKKQQV